MGAFTYYVRNIMPVSTPSALCQQFYTIALYLAHYEFAGQPEFPNFDVARNLSSKQESSQILYNRVKYAILNVT